MVRPSLVQEVTSLIQSQIEQQQLRPGDRLPSESELLKTHEVSRSVLREAIKRLETLGLVEVRQGQGMFVGDRDTVASCLQFVRSAMAVTPRDLTEFGELREALECWAARRAAILATEEQVLELKQLVAQLDEQGRSYEDTIQLDFAFHRKLFEVAGNELMLSVISVLQEFYVEGMLQTTPEPRDHDISRRLHRAIFRAVRAGDADAAEGAMKKHMVVTCKRLAAHAGQQTVDKAS